MSSVIDVSAYETDLERIAGDVLAVMLSANSTLLRDTDDSIDGYTSSVGFVGQWKGALLVRCGAGTAQNFARRLLNESFVTTGDVADAMGELANMIGGNLKSVLPPGVLLSLPSVALGGDLAVRICGGNQSHSSKFSCEAGAFDLTLVHVIER